MRFILAAMLLAAAPLSPVLAQKHAETSASREQNNLVDVLPMLTDGRAAQALEILDPILARYETENKGDSRMYLCADSIEESILLAGVADQAGKDSVVVVGSEWCFALWAKGYALVELHRTAEALPYLERAAEKAPLNSQYLSELGNAYQELKQWDKALATFTRAADAAKWMKEPQRAFWLARAWRGMGFSLIELGRWDEAEAIFRK